MSITAITSSSLGNVVPLARGARRKRWASRSIRALPPPKSCTDGEGKVIGVATGDIGVGKDGQHKADYTRGMELHGKYTLFAEGARGSLPKQLDRANSASRRRASRRNSASASRSCGRSSPSKHEPGLVQHTLGWPLTTRTGGGSFMYHFGDNLVSIGFVVHLNYQNPYLSPFEEFQRFKTHPPIRAVSRRRQAHRLWRARHHRGRLAVDAQARLPGRRADRLCGAGFVNVPRIKGSHNAMMSGMLAAEAVFAAARAQAGRATNSHGYEEACRAPARSRAI